MTFARVTRPVTSADGVPAVRRCCRTSTAPRTTRRTPAARTAPTTMRHRPVLPPVDAAPDESDTVTRAVLEAGGFVRSAKAVCRMSAWSCSPSNHRVWRVCRVPGPACPPTAPMRLRSGRAESPAAVEG
ncbi:hypothetical protein [Streptomyces tailanensis]|uniref:hypothetical protein n=1 Tax=Streptomyces tailanensis TaxID=2569858 RepID=UPI00122E974A|nr:hypothetical protein [Streptomyces tailanensis]